MQLCADVRVRHGEGIILMRGKLLLNITFAVLSNVQLPFCLKCSCC